MSNVIELAATAHSHKRQSCKGGRGNRSVLFMHMLTNHADLAADIATRGARWEQRAAEFAASGLVDGTGKGATAERCRMTWGSVRVSVAEAAAREAGQQAESLNALAAQSATAGQAAIAALLRDAAQASTPEARIAAAEAVARLMNGAGIVQQAAPVAAPVAAPAARLAPSAVQAATGTAGAAARLPVPPVAAAPQSHADVDAVFPEAAKIRAEVNAEADAERRRILRILQDTEVAN
jgi:hypothetical protein